MTEYDFVVVQMTRINAHVLQFFFSSEQCTNLKGVCIVIWKNEQTSALIFVICTSTKSYQLLTSFIYVIKETIMEHTYFKIRFNYQYNLIETDFVRNSVQYMYDHPRPKWIMRYKLLRDAIAQPCIERYEQMVCTGLFWFLNSCHWLLMLIHVNESRNINWLNTRLLWECFVMYSSWELYICYGKDDFNLSLHNRVKMTLISHYTTAMAPGNGYAKSV